MNGKLVRDKIPEIIATETGNPVSIKILPEREYLDALHAKLDEEVAEFHQSGDVEELVDIYEVIDAILALKHVSPFDFQQAINDKMMKRGSFSRRFFLVEEENNDQT